MRCFQGSVLRFSRCLEQLLLNMIQSSLETLLTHSWFMSVLSTYPNFLNSLRLVAGAKYTLSIIRRWLICFDRFYSRLFSSPECLIQRVQGIPTTSPAAGLLGGLHQALPGGGGGDHGHSPVGRGGQAAEGPRDVDWPGIVAYLYYNKIAHVP